jgi:alkanesulfonate monooxygenase SsuD/methylene tetrahydromethanopterin reductase-like flavin-dependent oxidoreductase (luciferase family)
LPFEGRGRLLDHTVEVCRTLWQQRRAGYSSPELTFDAIHQMPKPLQPGGVPIWVSGTLNRSVVRRLARFGSGWIPWGPDAADPAAIGRMRRAVEAAGRDPSGIRVVGRLPLVGGGTAEIDRPATARRLAAGITDFTVALRPGAAAWPDRLPHLVAAFRAATSR